MALEPMEGLVGGCDMGGALSRVHLPRCTCVFLFVRSAPVVLQERDVQPFLRGHRVCISGDIEVFFLPDDSFCVSLGSCICTTLVFSIWTAGPVSWAHRGQDRNAVVGGSGCIWTHLVLCPVGASPHHSQSGHVGSEHSGVVLPSLWLWWWRRCPQTSSSPYFVNADKTQTHNVEWKCLKKRNAIYVNKNPTKMYCFEISMYLNKTTKTEWKSCFPSPE